MKSQYEDPVKIIIETNHSTAVECLLPLLKELKFMGDAGMSRSIKIEDYDGKNSFDIDDDGPHKISSMNMEVKMKKSKASEIEHKTPPKEYREEGATSKRDYADSKRMKYPIHTADNARAALTYFSNPENRTGYSTNEIKKIAKKIISACKKYGITVSPDSYKNFGLKKSKKTEMRDLERILILRKGLKK